MSTQFLKQKRAFNQLRLRNVLGKPLKACCGEASCLEQKKQGEPDAAADSKSRNLICCIVTEAFFDFYQNQNATGKGEDLSGTCPDIGKRLCINVDLWSKAYEANAAPLVVLESTHEDVLTIIGPEILTALAEASETNANRQSFLL